jgi:hypothetical protein
MSVATTRDRITRWLATAVVLATFAGVLAGCSSVPIEPPYTDEELRAICERRRGWWRGDLIPGYCEFPGAFLQQAP